ncbi:MAG TPA: DUF5606 domain-containing protein [Cyclobacteriaceae bacterium]|jgi:hypothetical protein|nr:DUF5606 domain-containing protein [Cyclobacteriaceae bacterium]
MELSEIASLSGKGGLYKVVAPTKTGAILESLDSTKTRVVVNTSQRLSVLSEISIYTTTKEGTVALQDVLKKIHKDFKNDLGIDANADAVELKAFLKSVLPEYDEDRVYVSDMKKLVKWYSTLLEYAPEIFEASSKDKESKE